MHSLSENEAHLSEFRSDGRQPGSELVLEQLQDRRSTGRNRSMSESAIWHHLKSRTRYAFEDLFGNCRLREVMLKGSTCSSSTAQELSLWHNMLTVALSAIRIAYRATGA